MIVAAAGSVDADRCPSAVGNPACSIGHGLVWLFSAWAVPGVCWLVDSLDLIHLTRRMLQIINITHTYIIYITYAIQYII